MSNINTGTVLFQTRAEQTLEKLLFWRRAPRIAELAMGRGILGVVVKKNISKLYISPPIPVISEKKWFSKV